MSDDRKFFLVVGDDDVDDLALQCGADYVFRIEDDATLIVEGHERLKLYASEKKSDFTDLLWNLIKDLAVIDGMEQVAIQGTYEIVGAAIHQILAENSFIYHWIWDSLILNGVNTFDLAERQTKTT